MTQIYIVEIQQYANGEFGHLVHYAYDEDPMQARLKAESKYHEVLAAAAISGLPTHAAIMFDTKGRPLLYQCYNHAVVTEEDPTIINEETDGFKPEDNEMGEGVNLPE